MTRAGPGLILAVQGALPVSCFVLARHRGVRIAPDTGYRATASRWLALDHRRLVRCV